MLQVWACVGAHPRMRVVCESCTAEWRRRMRPAVAKRLPPSQLSALRNHALRLERWWVRGLAFDVAGVVKMKRDTSVPSEAEEVK